MLFILILTQNLKKLHLSVVLSYGSTKHVYSHIFLISVLFGGGWSESRPLPLYSRKK
jgi:hypothetical protein